MKRTLGAISGTVFIDAIVCTGQCPLAKKHGKFSRGYSERLTLTLPVAVSAQRCGRGQPTGRLGPSATLGDAFIPRANRSIWRGSGAAWV